jgi:hypothetical protein
MKENSVGIGLIGCGRAGMIHVRNFSDKVPCARMAAVEDVVEPVARARGGQPFHQNRRNRPVVTVKGV